MKLFDQIVTNEKLHPQYVSLRCFRMRRHEE